MRLNIILKKDCGNIIKGKKPISLRKIKKLGKFRKNHNISLKPRIAKH